MLSVQDKSGGEPSLFRNEIVRRHGANGPPEVVPADQLEESQTAWNFGGGPDSGHYAAASIAPASVWAAPAGKGGQLALDRERELLELRVARSTLQNCFSASSFPSAVRVLRRVGEPRPTAFAHH